MIILEVVLDFENVAPYRDPLVFFVLLEGPREEAQGCVSAKILVFQGAPRVARKKTR